MTLSAVAAGAREGGAAPPKLAESILAAAGALDVSAVKRKAGLEPAYADIKGVVQGDRRTKSTRDR